MGYAEKRKGSDGKPYYRSRYKRPDGQYGTVRDAQGNVVRFPTKSTAVKAARKEEEAAETTLATRGRWVAPEEGRITFGEYLDQDDGWLAGQELAVSSQQTYGHQMKHIRPTFDAMPLVTIEAKHVKAWKDAQLRAGCAPGSVEGYRKVLHLIFADAVEEGLIAVNPAAQRRGRGKRSGRSSARAKEKKITTALGALLLAERAALLSGRDDEFVACVLKAFTGMRWGEVVGLEPEFVRPASIRVEHQLYELDSGELHRCPPKDDSYRDIDAPVWLIRLVKEHIARTPSGRCECHKRPYVFRGRGPAGGGRRREGPTLADVAKAAGVSAGTVSNVLNRPDRVAETTRARVEKAVAELGFVRRTGTSGEGVHWRRSGFATWVFEPAATGWFPPKAPYPRRLVPVSAGPWPGVPVRGRNSQGRAEACWVPIQHGLTRHGLRHTHRTLMEELGTPKVLMDERMGHADSSVSARYAHVTNEMRVRLLAALTEVWEEALDERLVMCRSSPVPVLEWLLREREEASSGTSKIVSQISPRRRRA